MRRIQKKAQLLQKKNFVYAYEFDENLIPNEGDVQKINQRISDTVESVWEDTKNATAHVFQDSGTNSVNTATASALGFYAAGAAGPAGVAGALGAGAAERASACYNCHVGEPVSQGLSDAVNMIVAPSDSTGN